MSTRSVRRRDGLATLIPLLCILLACRADHASPAGEIVFVCEHGAAKSVVASEYFNKLAADRGLALHAIARGADPQANLSVAATKGLKSDGLAPTLDAPRPLTVSEVRSSAQIIAFDCDLPAMKALKSMSTCWDDVPTVSDDYPRARDAVRTHVAAMIEQMVANPRP